MPLGSCLLSRKDVTGMPHRAGKCMEVSSGHSIPVRLRLARCEAPRRLSWSWAVCVCVCVCVCVMRGMSLSSSSSTICSLVFPTYPLPTKTPQPGENPGSPRPPFLLDPVEGHFFRKPTLPTQHTDPPPPTTRAQSPQSPFLKHKTLLS